MKPLVDRFDRNNTTTATTAWLKLEDDAATMLELVVVVVTNVLILGMIDIIPHHHHYTYLSSLFYYSLSYWGHIPLHPLYYARIYCVFSVFLHPYSPNHYSYLMVEKAQKGQKCVPSIKTLSYFHTF